MKNLLIILGICFLLPISLRSQIGPYTKNIPQINLKAATYDVNLARQVQAAKEFEYHLATADNYFNYCVPVESNCQKMYKSLSHSSWLDGVFTFSHGNVGYTALWLKNGRSYYFHYIPFAAIEAWANSRSPGQFYHEYIRGRYSLSNFIGYEP